MSSLVIFFIATIAVIGPLYKVESAPAQVLDLNTILELVQQQQVNTGTSKQRKLQQRKDSTDSDSDSGSDSNDYFTELDETDDSNNNLNARLRKERIIDLIETVANENNNRPRNSNRLTYRKGKPNDSQNTYVSRSEKYGNSQGYNNVATDILDKLLAKSFNDEERKEKPRGENSKIKLKPNRLLPLTMNKVNSYDKIDNAVGLDDYSKVYIVLNPQAVRKSKNKNSLNDLISKVLSLSSPTSKKDRQVKRKPRRYKGFIVNNNHPMRRSRQSKERRDSMGDEYVQKKPRNAGGPSAGRTGIPYVRNRGNIYERDN